MHVWESSKDIVQSKARREAAKESLLQSSSQEVDRAVNQSKAYCPVQQQRGDLQSFQEDRLKDPPEVGQKSRSLSDSPTRRRVAQTGAQEEEGKAPEGSLSSHPETYGQQGFEQKVTYGESVQRC